MKSNLVIGILCPKKTQEYCQKQLSEKNQSEMNNCKTHYTYYACSDTSLRHNIGAHSKGRFRRWQSSLGKALCMRIDCTSLTIPDSYGGDNQGYHYQVVENELNQDRIPPRW